MESNEQRQSINVDEDIKQAIDKSVIWALERDVEGLVGLVSNRTKLSYSKEIIQLKLKGYIEELKNERK